MGPTLAARQDILENESITLDWMFRYSLTNDIVKVGPEEPAVEGGGEEPATPRPGLAWTRTPDRASRMPRGCCFYTTGPFAPTGT